MKVKPIDLTRIPVDALETPVDSPEVTEPPAHCWSIEKIKVRGVWMNPDFPWACLDIQTGNIDPVAYQSIHSAPYPFRGPFLISSLGPTTMGTAVVPPLNTGAWLSWMSANIAYIAAASTEFYNWVTSIHGVAPAVGEHVVLEELNPLIASDSIDNTIYPGGNELVEAYCLQYHGLFYGYAHGYDAVYTLLDAAHSNNILTAPSIEPCDNEMPQLDPSPCGEIGSINPETGGIVFAIEQGPNHCVWYEAAPTDILTHTLDDGTIIPVDPGGTPSAALGTLDCGQDQVNVITAHHTTSQSYTTMGGTVVPAQGPQWTNVLGNYYSQDYYVIPIGPGSDNPQIDASNYTDFIDVGATMEHFDRNGDPCFLYDWSIPYVPGSIANRCAGSINQVTSIQFIAAGLGAYTSTGNVYIHPFDVVVVTGIPDHMPWEFDPNIPCSGHATVVPPYTTYSCPTCTFPVWTTKFTKTILSPTGPTAWSTTGFEWGVYDRIVNPATRARFNGTTSNDAIGQDNTNFIDNYVNILIPGQQFHPTVDSRRVAAEEALKYVAPNQLLSPEEAGWFLPSMDEFKLMIENVGPDASITWANPANQTLAHHAFRNSFNDSTGPTDQSQNVYWTSSQDDSDSFSTFGNASTYTGTEPNKVAIAYKLRQQGAFNAFPDSLFTSRCHPLSVRPIRKYLCRPCPELEPEYNFRDSSNIWVPGDGAQGAAGGGAQALTPFVNIYSPGNAASSQSFDEVNNRLEKGVIGFERFDIGLATTDVMGNTPKLPNGRFDYNAYTTHSNDPLAGGVSNGRNSNGIFISIWDNQKQFIGKWHYRSAWLNPDYDEMKPGIPRGVRENPLNWHGYVNPCDNTVGWHNPSGPNQNCNPNPNYTLVRDDFPDIMQLQMRGVTLIEGSPFLTYTNSLGETPFRYGGNREELRRRHWPQNAANPIPFSDWHHPYMENVFNGWTSSYAYIKVECQATDQWGANAYNPMFTGNNTDIDGMHVQCLKNLFEDEYDGGTGIVYSPPNPDLAPYTGSILGCGDCSDHLWNNSASNNGGYGWQLNNPNRKGNSAFGDVYGINYTDGRRQEPGYGTHPFVFQNIGPILGQHPKHYAFIWHAAYTPRSTSINWFPNLHDGYNSCFGYRCQYKLGDIGPAGGIIVGVPDMTGDEVVTNGASTNKSDWYYEMSPVDLHDEVWGVKTEWGVYNSHLPHFPNAPMAAEESSYVLPSTDTFIYNGVGGNHNQSYAHDEPYTVTGSGIGRTYVWPNGLLTQNPPAGPFLASNSQSAFKLCEEYVTTDIYGNEYCDWYLPNIQESWYIMNNAPSGTFDIDPHGDSRRNLYWASNEYNEEPEPGPGSTGPANFAGTPHAAGWEVLKNNTMYTQPDGSFAKGVLNPFADRNNSAYAYNIAEKVTKGPKFEETDFYMYSPIGHYGGVSPWSSPSAHPRVDSIVMVFDASNLISSGQMFSNGDVLPPPFDVLGPCNWVRSLNSIMPLPQVGASNNDNNLNDINAGIIAVNPTLPQIGVTHEVVWSFAPTLGPHTLPPVLVPFGSAPLSSVNSQGFDINNYPNFPGLANSYALAGTIGVNPVSLLNWHTLTTDTKATYVVDKGSDLKVRAIRRFKCENECDQPGAQTSWPPH